MVFVTLGTQDKPFTRLLEAVEKAKKKGIIQERVVVQAGCTDYQSDVLEIFDLIPMDEFNKYLEEASIVITHGGVGSILSSLQKNKKVIAAPRLSKYKEHTNDHQLEIIEVFGKEKYILPLLDLTKFEEVYQKSKTFIPKKYKSNQQNFLKSVEGYLEKDHISWYNRMKKGAFSYFFVLLTVLLNYFFFWLFKCFHLQTLLADLLAFVLSFSFLVVSSFNFLLSKNLKARKKEISVLLLLGVISGVLGRESLKFLMKKFSLNVFLLKLCLLLIFTVCFSLLSFTLKKENE